MKPSEVWVRMTTAVGLCAMMAGCQSSDGNAQATAAAAASLASSSYRFPAEWEPQESQWLSWWTFEYGTPAARIQDLQVEVIRDLTAHQLVDLIVQDETERETVRGVLTGARVDVSRVRFHTHAHNDIWARDYGPPFVVDRRGARGIVDFGFNFYGYDAYESDFSQTDDRLDRSIASELQLPAIRCAPIHEGGNGEFDGRGTMIATEATERQRNPFMSLGEIEREFRRCYGVRQVIWMKKGLLEDDAIFHGILPGGVFNPGGTDGHVDDFVRFAPDNTILLAQARPEDLRSPDPGANQRARINGQRMEENLRILRDARDTDGRPFRIVRVPLAEPSYYELNPGDAFYDLYLALSPMEDGTVVHDGDVIHIVNTSSYLNYIIANGQVLMPAYCLPGASAANCRKDREVTETLARAYPGRRIVPLRYTIAANRGAGGPHCITQQQPASR